MKAHLAKLQDSDECFCILRERKNFEKGESENGSANENDSHIIRMALRQYFSRQASLIGGSASNWRQESDVGEVQR